jgi:hypothetical protein
LLTDLPPLLRATIRLSGVVGTAGMAFLKHPFVHGGVLRGVVGVPLVLRTIHFSGDRRSRPAG